MANGKSKKVWVGFDLGGTKMLATVFDDKFAPLGRKRRKTRGLEGADAGVERMIKTIDEALAEAGAGVDQLAGIGVGCPGPLDLNKGIIIESSNLGWKNVKLRQILSKKYNCPVAIANDVDVGTYGEYKFGAGKNARCVLGVFPGTGIGGGLVYDGRLFTGKNTSCMEFGHMMVDPGGRLCGCGRRGCLETVASRLAIASEVAMAVYRGEAKTVKELAGSDISEIRSGVLAKAVAAGDKVVEGIIRNAARRIGEAIANTSNLLAPDVVVLGGGLVEALNKLYLEEVRVTVSQRVMASFAGTITVKVAELGDNASVMGAAALVADITSGKNNDWKV